MDGVRWAADHVVNPLFAADPTTRALGASLVFGFGLLLTCLPFWLSADWGVAVLPIPESATELAAVLGVFAGLSLLVLLALAARAAPRRPALFAAATCFVGFGFLTSNLVFPIGTLFAERLLYTPSLAVPFALLALAPRAGAGRPSARAALAVALGLWLGANALVAVQRTLVWRDDATLIEHEVAHQPRAVRMRLHAARLRAERGQPIAAMRHLQEAVQLDPAYVEALAFLGDLQAHVGRDDAAVSSWNAALHGRARELRGREATLRGKLALAHARLGRRRDALAELATCRMIDVAHCAGSPPLRQLAADLAVDPGLPDALRATAQDLLAAMRQAAAPASPR